MRLNHFIGNFSLKVGELKIEDSELLNQARNVLKLKIGEKIILGDGNMNEGVAEILDYGKDFMRVKVNEVKINQNESGKILILYCSILKKENFELVVQKATEIGVAEIVPILTARTVKLDIRKDRLEKIIKEAAEQSGRGVLPVLREPIEFKEAIDRAKENSINILFDITGQELDHLERTDKVGVFIGPEGGWDKKELDIAKEKGLKVFNLGKLTLRAETAAIISSYIVHSFP